MVTGCNHVPRGYVPRGHSQKPRGTRSVTTSGWDEFGADAAKNTHLVAAASESRYRVIVPGKYTFPTNVL